MFTRLMAFRIHGRQAMFISILSIAALLLGCVSSEPGSIGDLPPELRKTVVVSFSNPRVKIPPNSSFFLVPASRSYVEDERVDQGKLDNLLKDTIRDTLERKGFVQGLTSKSDLMVGYVIALESTMNDMDINSLYNFKTEWAPGIGRAYQYDRGMLIIDVFDGRTRRPLWRGAVQAKVDLDLNEKVRKQRLQMVVERLLANLPR